MIDSIRATALRESSHAEGIANIDALIVQEPASSKNLLQRAQAQIVGTKTVLVC